MKARVYGFEGASFVGRGFLRSSVGLQEPAVIRWSSRGLVSDPCSPGSDLVLRCLGRELLLVELLLQCIVIVAEILDSVDVSDVLSS